LTDEEAITEGWHLLACSDFVAPVNDSATHVELTTETVNKPVHRITATSADSIEKGPASYGSGAGGAGGASDCKPPALLSLGTQMELANAPDSAIAKDAERRRHVCSGPVVISRVRENGLGSIWPADTLASTQSTPLSLHQQKAKKTPNLNEDGA
jgi:hypothetical protein